MFHADQIDLGNSMRLQQSELEPNGAAANGNQEVNEAKRFEMSLEQHVKFIGQSLQDAQRDLHQVVISEMSTLEPSKHHTYTYIRDN